MVWIRYAQQSLARYFAHAIEIQGIGLVAFDIRRAFGPVENEVGTEIHGSCAVLARLRSNPVRAERGQFEKYATEAVERYTDDQRVRGNALLAQARERSVKVDQLLVSLITELREDIKTERERVIADVTAATRLTLAADLLALLGGTILTLVILRSIAAPLRRLIGAIDGLGTGNLSVSIPPAGPDEIGAMARTLACRCSGCWYITLHLTSAIEINTKFHAGFLWCRTGAAS